MKYKFKRYLNKNFFRSYTYKRYKIKNFLQKKYKEDNKFYVKKNYIYYPIFWKHNLDFVTHIAYNAYQNQFVTFKKKFINVKYHKLLFTIRDKNIKIYNKYNNLFKLFKFQKTKKIIKFIKIYKFFFFSIYIDIFYFIKSINRMKKKIIYYLILSFDKNKLFINLKSFTKKNYLALSTGLFIKFFEKKKSFKKNKTIKLLMAKYIRKIFLITRIINTILIVKKTPTLFLEIINFFNAPIAHKFFDPVENRSIEETNNSFLWIKFIYFIFIENKNFSKNKMPQKGRIKRKILRKVTFENKIID